MLTKHWSNELTEYVSTDRNNTHDCTATSKPSWFDICLDIRVCVIKGHPSNLTAWFPPPGRSDPGLTPKLGKGYFSHSIISIQTEQKGRQQWIITYCNNTERRMSSYLSRTAGQWNRRHRHICWAQCSAHRSGSHSHTQLQETGENRVIHRELQTFHNLSHSFSLTHADLS